MSCRAPVAGLVAQPDTRPAASAAASGRRDGLIVFRAPLAVFTTPRYVSALVLERAVGDDSVIDVQLRRVALDLDAVVVTALGEATERRALGTAQQTIRGVDIAQTQRENFVNALQGRIAGVDVTSTSGVPGASASITIRGVTSISGSNQPLMIVDGLP